MSRVDLNCDLGEIPTLVTAGVDDALAASVTSINLACGGHAGDDSTMNRLVALAARLGTRVGAHPGYPDRAGFGRTPMMLTPAQVRATVGEQLGNLARIAQRHAVALAHVKPHGALYHAAAHHADVAEAVLLAVRETPGYEHAALVGPCGAPALGWWRSAGARVFAEAFADRVYEPDGNLRARTAPGALIEDPELAAAQAVRIALERRVVSHTGAPVPLHADTLCLHGDAPGAVERVRAVRVALEAVGVTLG